VKHRLRSHEKDDQGEENPLTKIGSGSGILVGCLPLYASLRCSSMSSGHITVTGLGGITGTDDSPDSGHPMVALPRGPLSAVACSNVSGGTLKYDTSSAVCT
jgi:hypothetical protein